MKKAKNKFRIGDVIVITKYEHGDLPGTITTIKDIVGAVLMLNTEKRTIFGHLTDTFVAQTKNCRLATEEEKNYFKKQKTKTCRIKKTRSRK